MAYTYQHKNSQPGPTVRTWTMPDYLAEHPRTPAFPPTSEAAARAVAIALWVLIAMGIVYIALRSSGLTG